MKEINNPATVVACDLVISVTALLETTDSQAYNIDHGNVNVVVFLDLKNKPVSPCKEGEFRCGGSNHCIPESKVCDAHKDCTNGEDEPASCGECCLDALGVGLFRQELKSFA